MPLVVPPRPVLITIDTTRGFSTKEVKKGTSVWVLATREDEDGLKLFVCIGKRGQPFQVRADVTSWFNSAEEIHALKL